MMQLDGLLFFILVICIGYLSVKSRLVPESAADTLPAVLINVCYPAMVLETFTGADTQQLLGTGLPVVFTTLAVTTSLYFSSLWAYRSQPMTRRPLLCFITGIGNVSYVAIPLMSVFLPPELLFVAIIHGAVQDFLIWSLYHQLFLRGGTGSRKELAIRVLSSPCLIAAVLGVFLAAFHVELPSFLRITITKINAATSPIALLLLGMLIHRYGLLTWRHDRLAVRFALGKVVVLPCCLFLLFRLFLPLQIALLLAILFGSPAPLTSVVWSKQYEGDAALAVNCCLASTIAFLVIASIALLTFTTLGIL